MHTRQSLISRHFSLVRSVKEKEILQKDDIRRLLEYSDLPYWPAFALGVLTGCRPGEILGLKKSDIHGDYFKIERAINAKGQITDCKNQNAHRLVPLGEMAKTIIQNKIQWNEQNKLHTDWIFSTDGNQPNQSTMRNQWAELKEERNLPGSVYSLRHTFISMIKNALPESQIKSIVGHSVSMQTIGGTYDHYIDGEERQLVEVIDLTFGRDLPKICPNEN